MQKQGTKVGECMACFKELQKVQSNGQDRERKLEEYNQNSTRRPYNYGRELCLCPEYNGKSWKYLRVMSDMISVLK